MSRRRWLWAAIGLFVLVPILLTLAGALTSPPHARSVPVGHLVYLEADEPSDHTSILRGLRLMSPDGSSRQILHETEPQDVDAGSREWITQPKVSPDGKWLAFEKQLITLQEEEQSIDNQLWVVPLTGPNPQPRMLLDLTPRHLKQFVGLAWTGDDEYVIFLEDGSRYLAESSSPTDEKNPLQRDSLNVLPSLKLMPDVSATSNPNTGWPVGEASYSAATPTGPETIVGGYTLHNVTIYAESNASGVVAAVPQDDPKTIEVGKFGSMHSIKVRWGWSVFGKRHITALHWSPDGKYLAYSVSKPPFEDELFYMDMGGRCFQLPVRTGRAGWDWGP